MKDIEDRVEKARRQRKIFMVFGHETLRQSLLARDWIEKFTERQISLLKPMTDQSMLALLARNQPHHFIWQPKSRPIANVGSVVPYMNTIIRQSPLDFTAKDGLVNIERNYRWFHSEGLTDLCCQRSHVIADKVSRDEFSEDFRRTVFTSFMIFLHEHLDIESLFSTSDDAVTTEVVDFTCKKLDLLTKVDNHDDIDTNHFFDFNSKYPLKQNDFLNQIRQIKNGTKKFKWESHLGIEVIKAQASTCVEKILNQWPFIKYDGYFNIWIMKPIGHSSGHGVTLMNSEEKIFNESRASLSNFVVQKYIGKYK